MKALTRFGRRLVLGFPAFVLVFLSRFLLELLKDRIVSSTNKYLDQQGGVLKPFLANSLMFFAEKPLWLVAVVILLVVAIFLIEEVIVRRGQDRMAGGKAGAVHSTTHRLAWKSFKDASLITVGAFLLLWVGIYFFALRGPSSSAETTAPVKNAAIESASQSTPPQASQPERPRTSISNPKKATQKGPNTAERVPDSNAPPPQPTPSGSITQSNSGGINVQQGTTGPDSPIINSPITIGNPPRGISPADMQNIVQFLQNAKAKTTVDIVADQFSGATKLPDDFYQAFKDGG